MPKNRNLYLMYAIALLQGMVFYAPVASLYRQAAGLNLAQIALIEGISYLVALAMELPWGMIADRIGYRKTMICGCGVYFLSKIVFWRAEGFFPFLLERMLLSIAISALSGVEESILYLSCGKNDAQHAFGISNACSTLGLLLSAGAYSLWMRSAHRLCALATAAAYGLAALLPLFLQDVQPRNSRRRTSVSDFLALLKDTLRRRRLLILLAGLALYGEAAQMLTLWLNQNLYLRCGMNSAAMGWAYIAVSAAALMSAFSQQLTRRLGRRRFAALIFLSGAAAAVLLVFVRNAVLSVLLVAAVSLGRALLAPLTAAICSDAVHLSSRATQLSVFAMVQNTAAAGATALLGRAADASLNAALMLCALCCLLGCAALLLFEKRINP